MILTITIRRRMVRLRDWEEEEQKQERLQELTSVQERRRGRWEFKSMVGSGLDKIKNFP